MMIINMNTRESRPYHRYVIAMGYLLTTELRVGFSLSTSQRPGVPNVRSIISSFQRKNKNILFTYKTARDNQKKN